MAHLPPSPISLRGEHFALVDFLLAIAEFDRLGVHRQARVPQPLRVPAPGGWACPGEPPTTGQVATRLVAGFPEIVEPLRDGRLCISNFLQLAKVMTKENRASVMQKFFHRSKEEAKQVAVEMLPAEVVPRRTVVTEIRPQ